MWLSSNKPPDPLKRGKKVACLVPSLTELLIELGLHNQIVARTKFCIHPKDKVDHIPRVGGTKTVQIEKLKSLAPDIVIGNKEENVEDDLKAITQFAPVFVTEITRIHDIKPFLLEMSQYIPELSYQSYLRKLTSLTFPSQPIKKKVAYLIWTNPIMVAAKDTYIHHILEQSGFTNVFADQTRYPEITLEVLIQSQPQLLFLSSEPFPFKKHHQKYFEKLLPKSTVCLVDGEIFSWYGIKTLEIPAYITSLLDEVL